MSNPPFPPPAAWVTCPKCTAQLPCYDPATSRYFCCFNCRTYFTNDPTAGSSGAQVVSGFKRALPPGPSLLLGAVGTLGGSRCRLTGYQLRGEKDDKMALWHEYQLRPAEPLVGSEPVDFPLQLAEYQGHWLLVRRALAFPNKQNPRSEGATEWTDADGHEYRLWHRYKPVVRDAQGEFDWDILEDENLSIAEYTDPPYLLVSEQLGKALPTWYLAEHLEPEQVAAAFGLPVSALPARQGIGAAQPAPVPGEPQLRQLGWVVLVLLVFMQLGLLLLRPPTQLLAQDVELTKADSTGTSQVLSSQSFNVDGPAALAVQLEIPSLDSHWVEVTASLVNEQTGRGYEFTRSVEYYQGNEGGEHWTEGSQSADGVLSRVPTGRYHVNLYPTLDPGLRASTLALRVDQHTPLWTNFWVVLVGLLLIPVVLGWRRGAFERERWANSNFSPYTSSFD